MTVRTAGDRQTVAEFSHEAFFYSDLAEFLDATTDFVREGVDADEAVLVAVSGERFDLLRDTFAGEASVDVVDMARLGANPARIIPAWRDFLDSRVAQGVGARGVGEPVWPGRTAAEMAECGQHESLLNVAFDGTPAWRLLCPYDVTGLPGDVLDQARANHPVLLEDHTWGTSPTYHSVLGARALRGRPLPPPTEAPRELAFAEGELGSVRRLVRRACAENGVPDGPAEDVVLAAHEVATNSIRHGGGRGVLRVWREPDTLVCEVSDEGNITNPLVGRQRPPTEGEGGRGLWLANQLCDLVQVRSGAAGTTVRLHVRRP